MIHAQAEQLIDTYEDIQAIDDKRVIQLVHTEIETRIHAYRVILYKRPGLRIVQTAGKTGYVMWYEREEHV
ncbi:MAG: hypothetical protein ACI32N_03825 [Bulleidia sp.]